MNHSSSETIRVGSGIRGIHLILSFLVVLSFVFWGSWFRDKSKVHAFINRLDFLKIKTIEVQTEWPLEANQVQGWVNELVGKSILLLDSKELAKSLEVKAWVAGVAVKKNYPNQVHLSLTSKRPQAMVVHKGQPWFIDPVGGLIDKVTPKILKGFELPFLSVEGVANQWDIAEVLSQYEKMKSLAKNKLVISQIVLGKYPYFKTYLSRPKIEVIWSMENWEDQLKNLITLIDNPPSQVGQLRRINLVFPKKAIVSSSISN
jgi:cell division septal protein FtsQ